MRLIRATGAISAWLFDLDGVLTDTAALHDQAWKEAFDAFLCTLDPPGQPFDPAGDYERFVDGRPHAEGARAFLASRGIVLPEGAVSDPPGSPSVIGITKAKDDRYRSLLDSVGVRVFPDAIELLDVLKTTGAQIAVVTASEHGAEVLAAAHLIDRFAARVDGVVAKARRLQGKPFPDTYLEAASLLHAPPERACVLEDAPAGVQAGVAGGFGLVIGVARRASTGDLLAAGAHMVVHELSELVEPDDGRPQ